MGKGHFVKNYPMNGHKLLRQHSKHKLSISVKTTLVGTRFSTWRNLRAIKQKPLEVKSPGRARLWARLPQVPLLTGAVRPGSPCSGQKRIRRHHCIFSSRLQLGRDRATVAFGSHPQAMSLAAPPAPPGIPGPTLHVWAFPPGEMFSFRKKSFPQST